MDNLKLENQLCFPLYALSRQITNLYRPLLEELALTYPQYLVMLLLWQHTQLSVKEIGTRLWLDSGTLTPLLKRLEQKGLIERKRDKQDERMVQILITDSGKELQTKAEKVPVALSQSLPITREKGLQLVNKLNSVLKQLSVNE